MFSGILTLERLKIYGGFNFFVFRASAKLDKLPPLFAEMFDFPKPEECEHSDDEGLPNDEQKDSEDMRDL